jgi:DNA-binding LytR/AlgR family response regulator
MKYKLIIDKEAEEEIIARVHSVSELTERIEDLVNSYLGNTAITVFDEDSIIMLDFSDIECITVIDRKVYAIDKSGEKRRISQRLYDVETRLPSYFIRINKSSIANERRIARFHTVYSGAVDAIFKCGYKEYVSRRCFAQIKRRLMAK